MPADDRVLRDHLLEFLRGGSAHADAGTALDDFPPALYDKKPEGAPHSGWQLLEHIRFTVHDLLDFCTNSEYLAPKWPDDYWPKQDAPSSASAWKSSVKALKEDLTEFERLIQNPESNLYAQIPWGDGQTMLREVLLVGDHTSYHLGQLVMLRKQLGAWD